MTFLPNGWEFLDQILHTYYTFLSTLDYKFLSNYLQFWRSYAIVSATTQFTPYVQNVHHWPKRTLAFSDITVGNFGPNFACILCVAIYARLQIFILLSLTVTKLCHIKCDHPACVSADETSTINRARSRSRLIWRNFVKVADNWIKICSPE